MSTQGTQDLAHAIKNPQQVLAFVQQHLPPDFHAAGTSAAVTVFPVDPTAKVFLVIYVTGTIIVYDPSGVRTLAQAGAFDQSYHALVLFAQAVASYLSS